MKKDDEKMAYEICGCGFLGTRNFRLLGDAYLTLVPKIAWASEEATALVG